VQIGNAARLQGKTIQREGMRNAMTFTTDDEGNVKLNPVTGWEIGRVAGVALALKLEYVSSPNQLESHAMISDSIQFVLTAEEALELAEVLKRHGTELLSAIPKTKRPQ
jgi:hypothetical protein